MPPSKLLPNADPKGNTEQEKQRGDPAFCKTPGKTVRFAKVLVRLPSPRPDALEVSASPVLLVCTFRELGFLQEPSAGAAMNAPQSLSDS